MRRVKEMRGNTPVLVEYLQLPPYDYIYAQMTNGSWQSSTYFGFIYCNDYVAIWKIKLKNVS